VRIIKDKSISRSIIHICAEIKRRCLDYQESAEEICAAAEEMLLQVQHGRIFGDATSTAIHNQALQ
jgi:replicative DNA helicase